MPRLHGNLQASPLLPHSRFPMEKKIFLRNLRRTKSFSCHQPRYQSQSTIFDRRTGLNQPFLSHSSRWHIISELLRSLRNGLKPLQIPSRSGDPLSSMGFGRSEGVVQETVLSSAVTSLLPCCVKMQKFLDHTG